MNYIAANLLYHADETLAFWLLEYNFKKYQIRDLYIASKSIFNIIFKGKNKDFPGLSKHLQVIDMLIISQLPLLHSHLVNFIDFFK